MRLIEADALLETLADRGLTGCAAITAEELEDVVAGLPSPPCGSCECIEELEERCRAMRGTITRQTRMVNDLQAEVERLRRMLDGGVRE